MTSRPPRAISLVISLILVIVWGVLRIVLARDYVLPLSFALPLLAGVWMRDRLVLWAMAAVFAVLATVDIFWILPAETLLGHGGWVYAATMAGIVISALVVHGIINLRERLETLLADLSGSNERSQAQNNELQAQSEELAQQNEELARQAEELQAQSEELQAQSEELQSLNEELRRANDDLTSMARFPGENPNPVLRASRDGAVLYANPPAIRLLTDMGWKSGELLLPVLLSPVQRVLSEGSDQEIELTCARGLTFSFAFSPGAGEGRVNLYGRDITTRKKAEQAVGRTNQLLQAILSHTHMLVACLDREFNFVLVNRAYAETDGKEPEFFPGKNHFALFPDVGNESTFRQVVTTGKPHFARAKPFEYANNPERGTSYWDWSLIPIADAHGHVELLVLTLADVTPLKRAQQELLHAKHAAENANAAKDQFLAVLSHELRTPLTPVLMAASTLDQDMTLTQPVRDQIHMIRRNIEMEARLIDDLLDLTRIARGKLQLHKQITDLRLAVEHAVHVCCTPEVARRGIRIVTELAAHPSEIHGDPARLQQVFWNLINNAIKFSPDGGVITIRSESLPHGRIRVEVTDQGIGIDPVLLPRLFNAFEQGDIRTTRRFGGLGLGLAISRAIVQMHDGAISAHSDGRNRGATFTVDLPLATEAQRAQDSGFRACPEPCPERSEGSAEGVQGSGNASSLNAEPRTLNPSSRPLRLLLVEDHVDTARMMSKLLQSSGHTVSLAHDVVTALQLVESENERIDLIISDLGLPDGTGLDLMRQVRQRYNLKGIALSGYGMEEDIRKSAEAGFAEHLTKPVDFNKLIQAIQRLVSCS